MRKQYLKNNQTLSSSLVTDSGKKTFLTSWFKGISLAMEASIKAQGSNFETPAETGEK